MIQLKQLSPQFDEDVYQMMQDIDLKENGFSNPAKGMPREKYKTWIKLQDDFSRGINLPTNYVPSTTFILYVNEKPVGYGRVRHSSNDFLEKEIGAGNLGYGIAKQYRGKGFGNILFIELLKECKKVGYKKIKLFPEKQNEATIKIMLKNGGTIVGDFKGYKHIIEIPIDRLA